jgi:hypothetical protein
MFQRSQKSNLIAERSMDIRGGRSGNNLSNPIGIKGTM